MEKYQRNTQVIDGTIDSSQVIMHVERGKYFGLNYLKYRKRTFTILNSIWNNENIGCRKRNGILLVFYILTTLILPIIYALLCHR